MDGNLAPVSGGVHEATLTSIRTLAEGVFEYVLTLDPVDADLRWRPGQFISLTCGNKPEGGPLLRSYSIANSPASGRIDLIVRLVDGGAASEWFSRLRGGERVYFTGPMGFFVLDLAHAGDQLFLATGTGIVPLAPMIRESLARDEPGRIRLLWGLREEQDIFWRDQIEELAASPRFEFALHLTRPEPTWRGAHGRINQAAIDLLPSLARPTFYLCGNGAMIREVKASLVERGVDRKRQIRTEAFFG